MRLSLRTYFRLGAAAFFISLHLALVALPIGVTAAGSSQRIEAEVVTSDSRQTDLVLTLRFPLFRAASLAEGRYSEGISLVAESDRPYVDDSGKVGSELVLELSSTKGGRGRVESLRIRGEGATFEIAPFDLSFPENTPGSMTPDAWVWEAPPKVWRFQSFALGLRPLDATRVGSSAWPSFQLPAGILLEAGADAFSWVATSLEAGTLVLPETRIVSSSEGLAPPRSILVEELPKAVRESRAIGHFSLLLDAPKEATRGQALRLRLVLSGGGNLPALRLPEIRLLLDDQAINVPAEGRTRIDSLQKTADGYAGSSSLDIDFVPDRQGILSFSTLPWRYLDPAGSLHTLVAAQRSIRIGASADTVQVGTQNQALNLIEGKIGELPDSALSSFKAGRTGEGLAALYHAARSEALFRETARRLAASLGAVTPDLGPPLMPTPFFAASGLFALAFILLSFLRRREKAGVVILALCLAFAIACLATASLLLADRERPRWLSFSTSMASTPSLDSERHVAIPLGSTGRKIGVSGEWICLEFPDGSAGWLPRSSVYSY